MDIHERLKALCIFCLKEDVPVLPYTKVRTEDGTLYEVSACAGCSLVPSSRQRQMRDVYEPLKQLNKLLTESPTAP